MDCKSDVLALVRVKPKCVKKCCGDLNGAISVERWPGRQYFGAGFVHFKLADSISINLIPFTAQIPFIENESCREQTAPIDDLSAAIVSNVVQLSTKELRSFHR